MFDVAKRMVEAEPRLKRRCKIYRRAITVEASGSSYHVLSSDAPRHHGKNSHGILFDELHVQPNRELWDTMSTSTGARRQPILLAITTAGFDRNSICWEQHDYAEKVREGIVDDPTFLGLIYAAHEDDDWLDEEVWKKANPNLGISKKMEYMREEAAAAAETPARQNTFRRLELDQWTEQATRFLAMDRWDRCAGAVPSHEQLEDLSCWGGLDLAATTDVCAFAKVFRLEGGLVAVKMRYWIPEATVELRSRRDRVPYQAWADHRQVIVTPGEVADYGAIREQVLQDAEDFDLRETAVDRWNALQIMTELTEEGLVVIPFGQGFKSMSGPTKELERIVVSAKLRHGGDPVLRWMASNVAAMQDAAGNLKPARDKSREKIDGIVALIMALGRAMLEPEEQGSALDDGELLVV